MRSALARGAAPLVAAALFLVGVTVILAVTTLWETPDTNCGQLLNPAGGLCDEITARRATRVAWTGGFALVVIVSALLAVRSGARWPSAPALSLFVVALAAGLYGTFLLAHGSAADTCGSTLSRVDPFGRYSSARPKECAPHYADDRRDAGIAGGIAAAAFLGGLAVSVRRPEGQGRFRQAEKERTAPPVGR